MSLFNMNFDRPGPGVNPDTPRKKGAARFFEVLGRDLKSFWLASFLAVVSALPFAFGIWFSVETHAILPMLLAGILGGMIAAPQLCGLQDTVLRSLRDEPGYWWVTYRRAWKRNVKASLLPGALGGLLLATQIFSALHLDTTQSALMPVALLVGAILLSGLAQYVFAQVVLLEMPFGGILKNAVFLFLGYLPRTMLGVVWQLVYWGAVALFWPLSSFVIVIAGFWLPALLSLMAIYPVLDKSFQIEENVRKMREEQLNKEREDS